MDIHEFFVHRLPPGLDPRLTPEDLECVPYLSFLVGEMEYERRTIEHSRVVGRQDSFGVRRRDGTVLPFTVGETVVLWNQDTRRLTEYTT